MNPAAEILTPSTAVRLTRNSPEVASRTGVSGRASRQANLDIASRLAGQFFDAPPGTYRLPTTTSTSSARRAASMPGRTDGGWLRSASITPSVAPRARSKPAMTALPSPSFPSRWTTCAGKRRVKASATAPVPSGELSSTTTTSPRIPCATNTPETAATSSSRRSRSLYVGTMTDSSGASVAAASLWYTALHCGRSDGRAPAFFKMKSDVDTLAHGNPGAATGRPGMSPWRFAMALAAIVLLALALRSVFPLADPPWYSPVGVVWHDEGAWVHNARTTHGRPDA